MKIDNDKFLSELVDELALTKAFKEEGSAENFEFCKALIRFGVLPSTIIKAIAWVQGYEYEE